MCLGAVKPGAIAAGADLVFAAGNPPYLTDFYQPAMSLSLDEVAGEEQVCIVEALTRIAQN